MEVLPTVSLCIFKNLYIWNSVIFRFFSSCIEIKITRFDCRLQHTYSLYSETQDEHFLHRLLMGLVYAFMVWISHRVQSSPGVFPTSFYAFILIAYALHQVCTV